MNRRSAPWVLSLCLALVGCDRAPQEPVSQGKPPLPASVPAPLSGPQAPPESAPAAPVETSGAYRFPSADRIVAIGDLHGDFVATERAFRLAGAIDASGKWAGGKSTIVQTGDQLDRGDDEDQIIEFLSRLQKEARASGGSLVVLNGNHETMNVMGDFRYVTPGAFEDFSDYQPASPLARSAPEAMRGRASALLPGGGAALVLAERPVIAMVGDTVFAHGGVLPAHVEYGIDRLNRETAEWMRGERQTPPAPVIDPEGPLWTRLYGSVELDAAACATLDRTLKLLGAARMVVGHTVQEKGMSAGCGERVFRIDVGLARHYGERAIQVLEIQGTKVRFLAEP